MSLSLGEKLRQAREARGISISEVAEQTRISANYLEAIENNDYRTLPGGIFNKGFVKSFAKFVGVDETEALQDYSRLMSEQGEENTDDPKTYRPEVLTDDQARSSLLPTLIFAAIIIGLMAWGLITLVNYYQSYQSQNAANTSTNKAANTAVNTSAPTPTPTPASFSGEMKVEFRALKSEVWLSYVNDSRKTNALVQPDKPATFEPKETLRLSYPKDHADNVQVTLNGKQIALPSAPANPKRNVIEIEITKETAQQIFQSGQISALGTAPNTNAATTTPR
jgi:Uncharacterized protein conserved in bacteria